MKLKELYSLVDGFNNGTLELSQWTHLAHIYVACIISRNNNLSETICRYRAGIILLNNNHGVKNTAQSGYHETLTVFWCTAIKLFTHLYSSYAELKTIEFIESSNLKNSSFPFHYYSKDYLLSPETRSFYHIPDKLTLNTETLIKYLN